MPSRERIGRFKYTPETDINTAFYEIVKELNDDINTAIISGDE